MKTENELLVQGIDRELDEMVKSLKDFNSFLKQLNNNDIEFCKGFLQGKIELLEDVQKLKDLRRSKLALKDLDSNYDIKAVDFSADDIPF